MSTNAQQKSCNGHETKGELACRNLRITADHLQEMRWMVESATQHGDKAMQDFDAGLSNLKSALALLEQTKADIPAVTTNNADGDLIGEAWKALRALQRHQIEPDLQQTLLDEINWAVNNLRIQMALVTPF